MNPEFIKMGMKYGPLSLVSIYLIYFMTTTIDASITEIKTVLAKQTSILEDIRYTLKAESGITFRNDANSQP